MRRYTFSLHRVLRVRAGQETLARQALRAAAEDAAAAEDEYDAKLLRYQAGVAGAASFRGTALNLLAVQQAASRRAREVSIAENASEAAQGRLDDARAAWSAAKQRLQSMEHLDERERARYQVQAQASEQAAMDDLVTGRAARAAGETEEGR